MATNVTYDSLVTDVQNYIERGGSSTTDTTVFNQIPRLINAAERKIMQFLKLQGEIEVLTDPAGLGIGQPVIPKPDRWRVTVSMNFGTGTQGNVRTPLYPRSYEYCRYYWPDDTLRDVPKFYADYNYSNWLIVPTPVQNYPLEIVCYMQPPLLDSSNQQNFFSQYAPNMLLYGALLEAAPFLKADDRIQVWQGYWDRELQSLSGQDLQKILDRAAQRKMA
jgi:hypothetical protein